MLLAALSAVGLALAFQPPDLSFLAWVALAPLITVVQATGPGGAYLLAGLAGLVFYPGVLFWIWAIPGFNLYDFLALELYFAQYFAFFGLFLNLATRRAGVPPTLAAPVLWVALEYLRSHFSFLALPMALLGHSQYRQLLLIQLASVTGVYGLSFLIVLVNAALVDLIGLLARRATSPLRGLGRQNRARFVAPVASAIILLGAIALHGAHILATEPDGERIKIGVLQRNLPARIEPPTRAERLADYLELSRRLASNRPELIAWPETAVWGPLRTAPRVLAPIADVAAGSGSYILVGSADSRKFSPRDTQPRALFNSAVLVSPAGTVDGVYDKIRLVPFGEYTPLEGIVAWPRWLVAGTDRLTPGSTPTVFQLPTARFGVIICWESLFPDLVRTLVRQGADFIVNITNEAWFGTSAAPEHLAAISVFRAVEHRVPLVRSANGGIAGFIDPFGRITGRVGGRDGRGAFPEGGLVQTIVLPRRPTFYTRYGDVFAYLCLGATLVVISLALLRRRGEA